jgi:hypothetical protein
MIYVSGLVLVQMVCARLQEVMPTSNHRTFHTTIENYDIPIRGSAVRSSSPPTSVARHPRRRPSGPDNSITSGSSSITVIVGESEFQVNESLIRSN